MILETSQKTSNIHPHALDKGNLNELDVMATTYEVWMNSEVMFSSGVIHMDKPVLAVRQKLKFTSFVQILEAV